MTAPLPYKRIASGSQWWGFIESLTKWNRYPRDQRELEEIATEAEKTLTIVPAERILFRARQMAPSDPERPHPPLDLSQMGAPNAALATGGRLNPPGIPYLYLAESDDVAVAEMRPTRNACYTVARFRVLKDLTVFDLATDRPLDEFINRRLVELLATAAVPDSQHAYAASQVIAERLKAGAVPVHGIRYKSAMKEGGVNLALFGGWKRDFDELVKPVDRQLVRVTAIHVTHAATSAWSAM